MKQTASKGFTLLELLVCIAILAIIVGVLAGVLQFALRSWKYGDRGLNERDAQRTATHLMLTQLRSAYLPKQPDLYFHGSSREMTFVTVISLFEETRGKFWVTYKVVEDQDKPDTYELLVSEKPVNSWNVFANQAPHEGFVPLLKGIRECRFAFLGAPAAGQEAQWRDEWNVTSVMPPLPEAVRIKLGFQQHLPAVDLLVPLYCSGLLNRMLSSVRVGP